MRNHRLPPIDLNKFYVAAPKDNGVAMAGRVSPDVKDAIGRIIHTGLTDWKKESDFVRAGVWMLLKTIQPYFTGGPDRDSIREEIRILNIHIERGRRLSRLYDFERFINSAMDVMLKCMAQTPKLEAEAVHEMILTRMEARRIDPRLEGRFMQRVEAEPKLAEVVAEAEKHERRRVEGLKKIPCECGHKGEDHTGDIGEGHCMVKRCGCEKFEYQDGGPTGEEDEE
jgi:hypothetical protein